MANPTGVAAVPTTGARTNVYIDGFNLYYRLKPTAYKWLDLDALSTRLLPKNLIQRVRYFTAKVDGRKDPKSPVRQQVYWRALATLPNFTMQLGQFKTRKTRMPLVAPPPNTTEVWKTEEKGSDVNLATSLLVDGFKSDYEVAVVISNDSDLVEPIRVVIAELGLPVGIFAPEKNKYRWSAELMKVASFFKPIPDNILAASQFPNAMADGNGKFSKPATWV